MKRLPLIIDEMNNKLQELFNRSSEHRYQQKHRKILFSFCSIRHNHRLYYESVSVYSMKLIMNHFFFEKLYHVRFQNLGK